VQSLHQLSTNPTVQPSTAALEAHIAELEMDVRNAEFRLQFQFNQRKASLELLTNAKRQLERLKK
jgi:FAD synthase